MQSLADAWVRSGHDPRCLYSGNNDEIITELKSWVDRRKTLNNTRMAESWTVLPTADLLQQIVILYASGQGLQDQADFDLVANFMAAQTKHWIHFERVRNEALRENHLANFFLISLNHQGVRWPKVLCRDDLRIDANVCACLGIVDAGFDSKKEQEILGDRARAAQWCKAFGIRNESAGDLDIAKHLVIGKHSSAAAIYTADLLGNTDVAAGETNSGTENHVTYIVDMQGKIIIATRPSSSVAADTPKIQDNAAASLSEPSNDTPNAAGTSSGTLMETGVESRNTAETEGRDEVGTMSKTQKKRERRKQAKADAKEAAANEEAIFDSIVNNDSNSIVNNDNQGNVTSLMDVTINAILRAEVQYWSRKRYRF